MKKTLKEFKSQETHDFLELKRLYMNQFDSMLKKQIEIPHMGTFSMSPFKIGLIACVNEYYFGNKNIVKSIIEDSFDVIIENKKSPKKPLNENRIDKFLKKCIKSNLIDKNYNLTEQSYDFFYKKDILGNENVPAILQALGFLIEIYLCSEIAKTYNTNKNEKFEKSINDSHIKYIIAILQIIYTTNLENLVLKNIRNLFSNIATKESIENILSKISVNQENFLKKLISPDLEGENLYFNFDTSKSAIDIKVMYNDKLVSLIDVKSSVETKDKNNDTVYNNNTTISSSKNAVINQFIDNSCIENDFNIGLLRTTYRFEQEGIAISKIDSIYTSYNNGHDEIIEDRESSYTLLKNKYINSDIEENYIVDKNTDNVKNKLYAEIVDYFTKEIDSYITKTWKKPESVGSRIREVIRKIDTSENKEEIKRDIRNKIVNSKEKYRKIYSDNNYINILKNYDSAIDRLNFDLNIDENRDKLMSDIFGIAGARRWRREYISSDYTGKLFYQFIIEKLRENHLVKYMSNSEIYHYVSNTILEEFKQVNEQDIEINTNEDFFIPENFGTPRKISKLLKDANLDRRSPCGKITTANITGIIKDNAESRQFYYEVLLKEVEKYKSIEANKEKSNKEIFEYFKEFLCNDDNIKYVDSSKIEANLTPSPKHPNRRLTRLLFGAKNKKGIMNKESFYRHTSSMLLKEVYSDLFIKRKSLRNIYSNIYEK